MPKLQKVITLAAAFATLLTWDMAFEKTPGFAHPYFNQHASDTKADRENIQSMKLPFERFSHHAILESSRFA